ncbi:hypothetical protein HYS50_01715 [Candidatus Woesearchaeota archaeon]|nr:hypothetical protein [Candidatus Woesearchaeota archaeon]
MMEKNSYVLLLFIILFLSACTITKEQVVDTKKSDCSTLNTYDALLICPDGKTTVTRNEDNNCEFYLCPEDKFTRNLLSKGDFPENYFNLLEFRMINLNGQFLQSHIIPSNYKFNDASLVEEHYGVVAVHNGPSEKLAYFKGGLTNPQYTYIAEVYKTKQNKEVLSIYDAISKYYQLAKDYKEIIAIEEIPEIGKNAKYVREFVKGFEENRYWHHTFIVLDESYLIGVSCMSRMEISDKNEAEQSYQQCISQTKAVVTRVLSK